MDPVPVLPQFREGGEEITQRDDTQTHSRIKVGPSTRKLDATTTERHPDERVAWKSDSSPEHAGVVTFHRLDDNTTQVSTQMDVNSDGFRENAADKLLILMPAWRGTWNGSRSSWKASRRRPEHGAVTSQGGMPDPYDRYQLGSSSRLGCMPSTWPMNGG